MSRSKTSENTAFDFGLVRVATATPRISVGNPEFNAREIISQMKEAERLNVDVLIFPELSVTGYTCADLFHNLELLNKARESIEEICQASRHLFGGIAFVGAPLIVDDVLFNCAVAVARGRILGVVPKTFLPNAGEFYEWRWFSSSESAISKHVTIGNCEVPFGVDLLFCAAETKNMIIGVDVCEDGWVPDPPSTAQALSGANLIVNISASPEWVSKCDYRRMLVTMRSATLLAAYLYTSAGVHESTSDLVFGGHQLICENGSVLGECKPFSRESTMTVADIDIERLQADRMRIKHYSDGRRHLKDNPDYRRINFFPTRRPLPEKLFRSIDGQPFVPRNSKQLSERCDEIFNIQVAGLAKRLEQIGLQSSKVVIGISGGLDSTLALLVACRTMDLLNLPRTNIRGLTMPGFGTTERTRGNAMALMRELGIQIEPISDIRAQCLEQMRQMNHKPFNKIEIDSVYAEAAKQIDKAKPFSLNDLQKIAVDLFSDELKKLPAGSEDLVFENVQARMRTKILMDSGFVLGTGDLSELALGWCTYNGDHMSMYGINAGVPKTLVKFLVNWAAENHFKGEARRVLTDIVETEISPELLPSLHDGTIAQKTENLIGPYELADFFLYYMLRFGFRPEKIIYLAKHAQFDREYTEMELRKWLKVFINRFFKNQFKRNCLPDGPKVGSVCLSPRGDWRMPSDADASIWLNWAEKPSSDAVIGSKAVQ